MIKIAAYFAVTIHFHLAVQLCSKLPAWAVSLLRLCGLRGNTHTLVVVFAAGHRRTMRARPRAWLQSHPFWVISQLHGANAAQGVSSRTIDAKT